MPPFDLYPCAQSRCDSMGHNAYVRRTCTCHTTYYLCSVCGGDTPVCPGCRHRAVLAQIAAGQVVFPDLPGGQREGTAPTAVGGGCPDPHVDQAGELTHDAQAVTVDAGSTAVYNAGECSNHLDALSLGDAAMASPVYVLVLPLVSHDLGHVLQALAPVIASQALHSASNGHVETSGQRLPRLPRKTYLSDKQCPSGHTYQDTGKVLRFRGNNQCVPCSGQRTPRAKAPAARTEG